MSLLRNAGSLAATSLVAIPTGLLMSIVLARYLGAEQMGFYYILQRFVTIGFVLCMMGTQSASIYRLRRARIEPRVVIVTSLAIVMTASLSATVLLFVGSEGVRTLVLGSPPLLAYYAAILSIPPQAVGRMLMSFARGLDRFALSNAYLLATWVGTCAAVSIGLAAFDLELLGAVAVVSGVHCLATLFTAVRVLSATGLGGRTGRHEIRETLRFGFKSQAQSILTHLHENVDVVILAALIDDPGRVAFYAIATSIVNRIKILPSAVANALLPHVAGQEREAAAETAARAARHSFFWTCVLAGALACIAPFAVPWAYGQDYFGVVRPILILLPATIFLAVNSLLARYFMASNEQGVIVRTQSCSTSLNVALNFILIPLLGVDGAALASLVSYGTEMILITTAFRQRSGIPWTRVLVLERGDMREYAIRYKALRQRRDSHGSD